MRTEPLPEYTDWHISGKCADLSTCSRSLWAFSFQVLVRLQVLLRARRFFSPCFGVALSPYWRCDASLWNYLVHCCLRVQCYFYALSRRLRVNARFPNGPPMLRLVLSMPRFVPSVRKSCATFVDNLYFMKLIEDFSIDLALVVLHSSPPQKAAWSDFYFVCSFPYMFW